MRENEQELLEQYDIDVKIIRRVRDGYLCDTNTGLIMLKELVISEKRLPVLQGVGQHLKEQGCHNVDEILKTKDGEFFCTSQEGTKYFVKRWFDGKECDLKKEGDLKKAMENLADIHRALQVPIAWEDDVQKIYQGPDLQTELTRHNQELKKVRSFIRKKTDKGNFEQGFLKHFSTMYAWAECASERLNKSSYKELRKKSCQNRHLIHGDYNYHNLIMLGNDVATTNFEHVEENIQVTDLYYFLRKTMEKYHWDITLGNRLIEQYQKKCPLSKDEMEHVGICLAYPEKFWKIANTYYRSRKVWVPAKNLEKLELVIKQEEEKKKFLEILFSFYL